MLWAKTKRGEGMREAEPGLGGWELFHSGLSRQAVLIRRHCRETWRNEGKESKRYLGLGESWRQREHSLLVFWALIQASRGGWTERGGPQWREVERPPGRPHWQFGLILCETGNLCSIICRKALCPSYILSVSQNVFFLRLLSDIDIAIWIILFDSSSLW